jgi:putative methionine-R-sulfoxide reductase with GAF domain
MADRALKRDYQDIALRLGAALRPDDDRTHRMRMVVDELWDHLCDKDVSWVGFYLKEPNSNEMVLGPRRDKPACSPIGMHGACGRCFESGEPLLVHDVNDLGPNYIACDPRDLSEVVVPIHDGAEHPVGVLDLDSFSVGAFDDADISGLIKVLAAARLCAAGH